MRYFILTNDVEYTLIHINAQLPSAASNITTLGIKRLLELYSKHNIKTTFYFTGTFAEAQPNALKLVKDQGHEIGCHSYSHDRKESLDILSYEEQIEKISKAKEIIEKIAGPIISFRAPELRINRFTVQAIQNSGFKTDSSVASQRFDGPLSLGLRNKINWLSAPRNAYFLSLNSPFKRGNSSVLELPVSAALFPYIGTFMRIIPQFIKYLEKYLFWEAAKTGKPIVFIFHPSECMSIQEIMTNTPGISFKRKGNFFSEYVRPKLKCRNLGVASLALMEDIIKRAKNYGFSFVTAGEFYNNFIKDNKFN